MVLQKSSCNGHLAMVLQWSPCNGHLAMVLQWSSCNGHLAMVLQWLSCNGHHFNLNPFHVDQRARSSLVPTSRAFIRTRLTFSDISSMFGQHPTTVPVYHGMYHTILYMVYTIPY